MPTAKQAAQRVLDTLPDSASLEEIRYHLHVLQRVESSRQAVAEDRVLSQEEVERRMERWL